MTKERQVRGTGFEDRGKTIGGIPAPLASHLAPRTSNLVFRSSGFTLLELLVVLVILSFAAALVAPRLPLARDMELKSSARRLAASIRYLEERAVSSKSPYRLRLDISAGSVRITRPMPGGEELPPCDELLSREILGDGIAIADVTTARLGKLSEGKVIVDIGGAGLTAPLTIHLQNEGGQAFTVAALPGGGKVKVMAGYGEVTL